MTDERELRMAAIFRADCPLPPGKMAAQSGHAFLTAWIGATDREAANLYMANSQAKLVFMAPDLATLLKIGERAMRRGVSAALITDLGRTVLAGPTVTVLGLGPMNRTDFNNLTKKLDLAA
jgi:peptidyl-tRNA hydrolase